MKMFKRVFVCLIVLALSVSILAFGSFAAESRGPKYTLQNYQTILEYYNEPTMFSYGFDDLDAVESGYTNDQLVNVNTNNVSHNTVSIVDDGAGDKHLSIKGGANPMQTNPAFLSWNAAEGKNIDDFSLEFDIKMKNNMPNGRANLVFSIYVADSAVDTAGIVGTSTVGTNLFKFNFGNGNIYYYNPSAGGTSSVSAGITANTEYHVSMVYSVINSRVDLRITLASDGSEVYTLSNVALPTRNVGNIRMGSAMIELAFYNQLDLDNVYALGGSFARTEEDRVSETERAISDFIDICESEMYSVYDKIDVLTTGMTIINEYGFVGSTDDANANIIKLKTIGVEIFASQLAQCLNSVKDSWPYSYYANHISSYKHYNDLIPEDISFVGDDKLAEIRPIIDAYRDAYDNLGRMEADSEAFVAALSDIQLDDANSENYSYIKSYYDVVKDLKPYSGYPGVSALYDEYELVVTLFKNLEAKAVLFTESVAAAANTESGFATRLEAYMRARDNYFSDPAYDGIAAILEDYVAVDVEMTAAIETCEHFIENVNSAKYSNFLSVKKKLLDAASRGDYGEGEPAPAVDAQLNIIKEKFLEYSGIPAAIEQYESLVKSVAADEASALAYVTAVNNLVEGLDTLSKDEIRSAIAAAEKLQETGNIMGAQGVTGANITLNNIKSNLELTEGYVKHFSGIITKIEATTVAADLFDLAFDAFNVLQKANEYEGVNSADEAKLNAVASEYNTKIQALNAAFVSANDAACKLVSASSGSSADDASIGRVNALIKKFYE